MRMALLPSGSHKAIELVEIETTDFTLYIKGKVEYTKHIAYVKRDEQIANSKMLFAVNGEGVLAVNVYNAFTTQLEPYIENAFYPIFFENGRYEFVVIPEHDKKLSFYHEFAPFQEAISALPKTSILTGVLDFKNEVGYSLFEIRDEQTTLVTVRMEIFPTKLDYKEDYQQLLQSVNKQVYNLAYHFVKRTYLSGSAEMRKDPSLVEFYRLLQAHYDDYFRALRQVERMPHHQIETYYEETRGDRLRKQDSVSRAYLRKNAQKMVDVTRGIPVHGRVVMPQKGQLIKKQQTIDTHENRYVKYTMQRIVKKLENLKQAVTRSYKNQQEATTVYTEQIEQMITGLRKKLRLPFWQQIGKLDRSVMSLVLQMGSGYREVVQIFVKLSHSIVLQDDLYKMAVKDIATLYEFWTFLQLGEILEKYCEPLTQDILKQSKGALFLNLQKNVVTTRAFKMKDTDEIIELHYQYTTPKEPTGKQKPDSMLSIEKHGRNYAYQYVFDAKYRIDVENTQVPGPKQDDINTMHRYRDSIVVATEKVAAQERIYERTAFGAYVLFPWYDDVLYKDHKFYKSIKTVNIGGLPFLPNNIGMVEEVIDVLLTKSADELQAGGILPIGTKGYLYPQQKESLLGEQDHQQLIAADSVKKPEFEY